MSNGLVNGVADSMVVLAVLVGMATLLSLSASLAVLSHRRTGELPYVVRYLPVADLAAVLGLSGAAAVAFLTVYPHVSGMLVAVVAAPLGLRSASARWRTDLDWMDAASVTAMAWGLPFLLGLFVVFALTVLGVVVLGPPAADGNDPPFLWLAAGAGGVTTVVATLVMVERISRRMPSSSA